MIRLTASRLSRSATVALLLLPLGAGCSSTGAATVADAGDAGEPVVDSGKIRDSGKRADAGHGNDSGGSADVGRSSDVGSDVGTHADGGADARSDTGTLADGSIDGGQGGDASDASMMTTPTVIDTTPFGGATLVPLNANVAATFSEAMTDTSLTMTTFTLASTTASVAGTVNYANSTVIFQPTVQFASNAMYTATITTGAISALGVPLAANYTWSFTTGTGVATGLPVNLGTAGNYVILSKSGISTVPVSAITGDIAVSPAAATYITGFSLIADPTNVFSRSTQVIGKVYAATYKPPTPANLTTCRRLSRTRPREPRASPSSVPATSAGRSSCLASTNGAPAS